MNNMTANLRKQLFLNSYLKLLKFAKIPFITLRMDIINRCNLRCKMCFNIDEDFSKVPLFELGINDFEYSFKSILPYVRKIMLSCGFEPLLSEHFLEIVKYINNNHPHIKIGFCTNALLLDSKIRKYLLENHVDTIYVSIDGATKKLLKK